MEGMVRSPGGRPFLSVPAHPMKQETSVENMRDGRGRAI